MDVVCLARAYVFIVGPFIQCREKDGGGRWKLSGVYGFRLIDGIISMMGQLLIHLSLADELADLADR